MEGVSPRTGEGVAENAGTCLWHSFVRACVRASLTQPVNFSMILVNYVRPSSIPESGLAPTAICASGLVSMHPIPSHPRRFWGFRLS